MLFFFFFFSLFHIKKQINLRIAIIWAVGLHTSVSCQTHWPHWVWRNSNSSYHILHFTSQSLSYDRMVISVLFGLQRTISVRVGSKMVNILTTNLMHLSQASFCLSHLFWLNKVAPRTFDLHADRPGTIKPLTSENCCTATSLKLNTEVADWLNSLISSLLTENSIISIFHNAVFCPCVD